MCLHWITGKAAVRNDKLSKLLEGSPVLLGRDGQVDEPARQSYSISNVDVLEALHENGISSIDQADRIVVEPNGKTTAFQDDAPRRHCPSRAGTVKTVKRFHDLWRSFQSISLLLLNADGAHVGPTRTIIGLAFREC